MSGYFLSKAKKTGFSGKSRDAYIALISFLIVSSVALFVGVALALLGISEAQMSLSDMRGRRALALAEGCTEDALLSVYRDIDYTGGIKNYPEGFCDIVAVETVDSNWTITTTATASGHTKRIEVTINRGSEITVDNWEEKEIE